MCRTWPKCPQPSLEALLLESPLDLGSSSRTNSWPTQTSSSYARTSAAVSGPADRICPPPRKLRSQPHQPHPASTATQSYWNSELQKSTTRLDDGPSKRSSLASRRTARRRPHLAQASPESGTRERETPRLRHTWEPSWQPSRASEQ